MERNILNVDKLRQFTRSQFKIIYALDDLTLVSVRIDGDAKLTQQEFNALTLIGQQGLRTPNPQLVTCSQQGKTVSGIQMVKVDGTSLDFNKVTNKDLLFDAIVKTLQGKKVEFLETSELRVTPETQTANLEQTNPQAFLDALQKVCEGIQSIFNAKTNAAINDLQIIVSSNGDLTIIDPTYAPLSKAFGGNRIGH